MPRTGLALALAVGLAASPRAPEASAKDRLQIRVPRQAGTAVERAIRSSRRRLADPVCQDLFSEFSSALEGRSIREVLDSRGTTAAEHLATLVFRDGSADGTCSRPGVLAFTRVGARTVFICPEPFVRAVERDPSFAEIALIHELLHTLGVPENPPSSREITARVTERCGDWRKRQGAPSPPQWAEAR
jgi:hypothetical protein